MSKINRFSKSSFFNEEDEAALLHRLKKKYQKKKSKDNAAKKIKSNLTINNGIIRNYASHIIPSISDIQDKVNEDEWNGFLKVLINRVEKSGLERPVNEDFVKSFMSFLKRNEPEIITYTIKELDKIGGNVDGQFYGRSLDLETIICNSVETRNKLFSLNDLSELHSLLFKMYINGGRRFTRAVEFFDSFATSLQNIGQEYRQTIIEGANKILNKKYRNTIEEKSDDEESEKIKVHENSKAYVMYVDALKNKNELIASYGKSAERNIKTLGNKFPTWIDATLQKFKTTQSLKDYLEDKHNYFSEGLQEAAGGLALATVHGRLLSYVQALSGKSIKIEKGENAKLTCSFRESTFYLPPFVNKFESEEENFKIYKSLVSYHAGAFIFGTYTGDYSKIDPKIQKKIPTQSLKEFFSSFENPDFSKSLFELLEMSRLDSKLKKKFPGLREDLRVCNARMAAEEENNNEVIQKIRSYIFRYNAKEGVEAVNNLESILLKEMDSLRAKDAGAEKTLEATYRIYSALEKEFDLSKEEEAGEILDLNVEIIDEIQKDRKASYLIASPGEEVAKGKKFRYKEWDDEKGSYKEGFVQVVEASYPQAEGNVYVDNVLHEEHRTIDRLRRVFESLRPEEYKKVTKQISGEVDFNEWVNAKAEMSLGITPSEKIYTRRYKNQRSVASIILAESSGSLRKFIDINQPDSRIIDIIKRTQIYFAEALNAIGDSYALSTFSGSTERNVEFYLLKDFNEQYNERIKDSIGSIKPLAQNRDGAGIRHATNLLVRQPQKSKFLFYLMEGLPHDFGYEKDYAIADTKKAIIESKQKGIIPVVMVFGKSPNEQIRSLADHCIYRETKNPKMLPELLPRLYGQIVI